MRGKLHQQTRTSYGRNPRQRAQASQAVSRTWDELDFSFDKKCQLHTFKNTKILMAEGYPKTALKTVINLLDALPEKVRKRIKSVLLTDEKPNSPTVALCDHENQELIFFGSNSNRQLNIQLTPITFFHEAAHLAEDLLAIDIPMDEVIANYKQACSKDFELHSDKPSQLIIDDAHLLIGHEQVTEYAKLRSDLISEDWAESFALYLNARKDDSAPYDFKQLYPHRTAFIEKYLLNLS